MISETERPRRVAPGRLLMGVLYRTGQRSQDGSEGGFCPVGDIIWHGDCQLP